MEYETLAEQLRLEPRQLLVIEAKALSRLIETLAAFAHPEYEIRRHAVAEQQLVVSHVPDDAGQPDPEYQHRPLVHAQDQIAAFQIVGHFKVSPFENAMPRHILAGPVQNRLAHCPIPFA